MGPKRIGFLSTRFAGTDGVTLESAKWAHVMESRGARCYWMAGQLDKPDPVAHLEPLAFFNHPEILEIQDGIFGRSHRTRTVSDRVQAVKERLKSSIYEFLNRFQIDLLIPQNVLAIPMHVPLGLAISEVIAETKIPVIAHHHDFAWERERFTPNAAEDYLAAAFPPALPGMHHVVINSLQRDALARRLGLASTVIPNVMDFEIPAPGIDDFNHDFRDQMGIAVSDTLVLQPTRLVARKGIEHTVELLRRLQRPGLKLVFSHPPGDEGTAYHEFLIRRIAEAGVDHVAIWDRIGERRSMDAAGRKRFTLQDVYPHADLVAYPSLYEGFGNAFLEAVYFGKPVVINSYPVFARDIAPHGFQVISMPQRITDSVLEQTREILANASLRREWADTNIALGKKYFSYPVLRDRLAGCLAALGF